MFAVGIFIFQMVAGVIISKLLASTDVTGELVKGLTYNFPLFRLCDFTIGCCYGFIARDNRNFSAGKIRPTQWRIIELVSLISVCLITILCCYYSANGGNVSVPWWGLTVLNTWTAVAFVYLFFNARGLVATIANNKILLYLGNMSANLYLIHEVLIRWLNFGIWRSFHVDTELFQIKLIVLIVALPLSILVAIAWNIVINHAKGKSLTRN